MVTARRLLHESLELAESVNDRQTFARALHGLGIVAFMERDFVEATYYLEQSLRICREVGDGVSSVMELGTLALLTYQIGNFEKALAFAGESLTLRSKLGAHASMHEELAIIAGLAARRQKPEPAARLYGAADRLRGQMGFGKGWFASTLAELIRRDIRLARSRMGVAAFVNAVAAGRALGLDEAVAEAFVVAESITGAMRSRPGHGQLLTGRERQVADLVACGFTNRQIAVELVFTETTAAKHVEHILDKLGFTSRSQIAAWVAGAEQPVTSI
jgi:non-specific serine/threonine protein kinase